MPSIVGAHGVRYVPLDTEESNDYAAEVVPLTSNECSEECEVIPEREEVQAAVLTVSTPVPPPPCYDEHEQGAATANNSEQHQEDEAYTPPPDYNVASKLPTYEEAERTKDQDASNNFNQDERSSRLADSFPYRYVSMIPGFDDYQELDLTGNSTVRLGNDVVFFSTFLVAFLFNWIGFLICHCFSQSVAGRFGALAGFGLSMVKWTVIMKHTLQLEAVQTEWLWWIILLLGLLMFFRGTVQYIRIKHQWSNLTSEARMRYARFF